MDSIAKAWSQRLARRWLLLLAIAIGGSAIYGASLASAIPYLASAGAAAWLTLGAAAGWMLLIPALWVLLRLPLLAVVDACLISMAYGEAVLLVGAVMNFTGVWPAQPVAANAVVVLLSNILMAAVLTKSLHSLNVQPKTSIAVWMFFLNGGGGLAFWLLAGPLLGGR